MGEPLEVVVLLNEPQLPELPQVTVQLTPLLARSFETVAMICAAVVTFIDEGGGCEIATWMAGMMVTVAVADFVGSVTEVAVIVTVPPLGTDAGAV